MTSTQTSFSAFAAKQTAIVQSLAVPADAGQRGCLPSCPLPLPRFRAQPVFMTGSSLYMDQRGDYPIVWDGVLDAPDLLASGSVFSLEFGRGYGYLEITAFSQDFRPRWGC